MKIVIDGVIFGLQKAGGISRVWAETLLGFDRTLAKDHKVIILIPRNCNIEWKDLEGQLKNIKVYKRKRFRWNRRKFWHDSLYLTWIALRFRPDVWHSSYYVGMPYYFCPKKIVTLHDMIAEKLNTATSFETSIKYKALQASNEIVVISRSSKNDLIDIWPHFATKSLSIPVCAPSNWHELTVAPCEPYFLFVGKRGGYKNFVPTIEMILQESRFDRYLIKVVGGEPSWSEQEEALVQKYPERIKHEGTVSHMQVQSYLASATALLFPSLYEGFGLPILEAFCMNVPVLAFRCSSIPEVTGDDYPLVDPAKLDTLPETLQKLMNERQTWIAYGQARKEHFTADKMVKKLIQVYL